MWKIVYNRYPYKTIYIYCLYVYTYDLVTKCWLPASKTLLQTSFSATCDFSCLLQHITLFSIPKKLLHIVRNKTKKES